MYSANLRISVAVIISLVLHLGIIFIGHIHGQKKFVAGEIYETMSEIQAVNYVGESANPRKNNNRGYWKYAPLNLYILEDGVKIKKFKTDNFDPQTLKKPKVAPIVREPMVKPKLIKHNPVPYPAKANGHNGRVIVCVLVGVDGVPEYVSTAGSSGNPFLDGAALEECIKWRFSPAEDADGNYVRCLTYISVDINK